MPIANVSDIVGKRDLVAEAQGWSDQMIKWKELRMKQEEAEEENKPKPYKFDLAEFGTDNENMLHLQENLNDQAYEFAMANGELLRIDPFSEDCGPNCKRAHSTLNNMKSAAKIFSTYGNDIKTRHDTLANLVATNPEYNNAENRKKLEDMKNVWKQGMGGESYNFTFGPDGRLVVDTKSKKQTQKILQDASGAPVMDDDGNPVKMYVSADNNPEGTEDPSKARKDTDGNPIPLMVDMDTGQDTDFETNQKGFGNWLTDLGFSEPVLNSNSGNFADTMKDYSLMIGYTQNDDGSRNYENNEVVTKQGIEAYIFTNTGYWNDETGTGVLAGHSDYLKKLVEQDKIKAKDTTPITKQNLIDKAYDLGLGLLTGGEETEETTTTVSMPKFHYQGTLHNPIDGVSSATYQFEGQEIGGLPVDKPYLGVNVEFNPSNISLVNGDDTFRNATKKQLSFLNDELMFEASAYGSQLFDGNGRAISSEEYGRLSLEEKKRCKYDRALRGKIRVPQDKLDELIEMGFVTEEDRKMQKDGDFVYLNAIIPAGRSVNRINSLGSMSADGVTKNEKLGDLIDENNKKLQDEMKKKWKEEEGGDGNNNSADPLNILGQ
jgi:hypothetical protein